MDAAETPKGQSYAFNSRLPQFGYNHIHAKEVAEKKFRPSRRPGRPRPAQSRWALKAVRAIGPGGRKTHLGQAGEEGKIKMKPGWVRRRGSDLIAIGLGVPFMLFLWAMTRGLSGGGPETPAINRAVQLSPYFFPMFFIGVALRFFGARNTSRSAGYVKCIIPEGDRPSDATA